MLNGTPTPTSLLEPIDAADTAAASSAYVDVKGYEGQIWVICHSGILDAGSVTWTFSTATDSGGTGAATIVPIGGALTQVTTSNDHPNIQVAVFDCTTLKGFLKTIGTVATGGALVSTSVVGIKKYAS